MIHHISINVHHPLHVAQVLAELLQGEAVPFSPYPGGFVALEYDQHGTLIEVLPRNTKLMPGETAVEMQQPKKSTIPADGVFYTGTHIALSVSLNEAEIQAIATREGWLSRRCNRSGFFDVIEFWIENQLLLELFPPALATHYLSFMQPRSLQQFLRKI